MNDLISRQAAIDFIDSGHLCNPNEPRWSDNEVVNFLKSIPSADVVEVVRCKDCRWGKEVCGNIECFADTNVPPEYHGYYWFCPNGERRTDGEEV